MNENKYVREHAMNGVKKQTTVTKGDWVGAGFTAVRIFFLSCSESDCIGHRTKRKTISENSDIYTLTTLSGWVSLKHRQPSQQALLSQTPFGTHNRFHPTICYEMPFARTVDKRYQYNAIRLCVFSRSVFVRAFSFFLNISAFPLWPIPSTWIKDRKSIHLDWEKDTIGM